MTWIYGFAHRHSRSPKDLKDLLGGKGANLAEMTSVLELPVPPGFTITTEACRAYMDVGWPAGLDDEVDAHVEASSAHGQAASATRDPLLVSVRSGADVLDARDDGHGPEPRAERPSRWRAWPPDRRRRFALDSLPAVRRHVRPDRAAACAASRSSRLLDEAKAGPRRRRPTPSPRRGPAAAGRRALQGAGRGARPASRSPRTRACSSGAPSRRSSARGTAPGPWPTARREHIPHDLGTAVNVQAMVFGNRDDHSGTGVGFTRNPSTGESRCLRRLPGRTPRARTWWPASAHTQPLDGDGRPVPGRPRRAARRSSTRLERHYRDMLDTEFTIEQRQALDAADPRRQAHGSRRAAHGGGYDRGPEGASSPRPRPCSACAPTSSTRCCTRSSTRPTTPVLATGLAASPGAAVGRVYFDADRAEEAVERGERVILVRHETSPDDVHGMAVAEGVLTSRGGLVSHAAVVARGWGKPAVVRRRDDRGRARLVHHLGRHRRRRGRVASPSTAPPGRWCSASWAWRRGRCPSEFGIAPRLGRRDPRRPLGVRANADTGADAARARALGAEGIGLCRTEHMFLGEDRLPLVRRMILADDPGDRAGGAGRAARGCSGPTSWRCSRRWTGCRSPSACSTHRCTSSCPRSRSSPCGKRPAPSSPRRRAARTPPVTGSEHEPHARAPAACAWAS